MTTISSCDEQYPPHGIFTHNIKLATLFDTGRWKISEEREQKRTRKMNFFFFCRSVAYIYRGIVRSLLFVIKYTTMWVREGECFSHVQMYIWLISHWVCEERNERNRICIKFRELWCVVSDKKYLICFGYNRNLRDVIGWIEKSRIAIIMNSLHRAISRSFR